MDSYIPSLRLTLLTFFLIIVASPIFQAKASTWQTVETWTDTIHYPTWQNVETWTGTIRSLTPSWKEVETWTGTFHSGLVKTWQTVETWTGTIRIEVLSNVFGNTYIGIYGFDTSNAVSGSNFTCPENCSAMSISVALFYPPGSTVTAVCGIYNYTDMSLVGYTTTRTIILTSTKQWFIFPLYFPQPKLVENQQYIIVVYASSGCYIAYDSVSTQSGHNQSLIYTGSLPEPYSPSNNYYNYSIYCTYVPKQYQTVESWFEHTYIQIWQTVETWTGIMRFPNYAYSFLALNPNVNFRLKSWGTYVNFNDWAYFNYFYISDERVNFYNMTVSSGKSLIFELGLKPLENNVTIYQAGDNKLELGLTGVSGTNGTLYVYCFGMGEPNSVSGATEYEYNNGVLTLIDVFPLSSHVYISWLPITEPFNFFRLPYYLSLRLGGSEFANGILITLILVLILTLPCIIFTKSKMLTVVLAFVAMGFSVYLSWFNIWIAILIGLLFILLYWKSSN